MSKKIKALIAVMFMFVIVTVSNIDTISAEIRNPSGTSFWEEITGGILSPKDETLDFRIPSLVSCNTIDTNSDGDFECGTDEGGTGSTLFTALTDTPSSYTGQTGKCTSVNAGETALEFVACAGAATYTATDIEVEVLGTPTYDDVQDVINTTGSSGKLSGDGITDNSDGTVAIGSGQGLIRATNSDYAELLSFDWAANASLALVDEDFNYIYVEYNAGSPIISSTVTPLADLNTNILLGGVFREGTVAHIVVAGQDIASYAKNDFVKDIDINGRFQRASGLIISETGTRNIALTAGKVYAGIEPVAIDAFDSSGSDTFCYFYRDGVGDWNKLLTQTQIDNLQYDDGSGTLASISFARYGVSWIYENMDSEVCVVYGRDSYTLSEAEDVQPPGDLPDKVAEIGGLVGKSIIARNASSFTDLLSPFDVVFTGSAVANHNELGGLQGGTTDEYYHMTSAQSTQVVDWVANGIDISDDTNLAVSGTLLDLTGDTLSVNEGTLTDTKVCTYEAATGINCNSEAGAVYTAGDYLTLTANDFDLDNEVVNKIQSIVLDSPVTGDSETVQTKFANDITINRISCSTDTGTASIQLDERAEGTPNTSGTDVLTSVLVCDDGSESSATFTNAGITADAPLNLDIDAVASTPTKLRIHIEYTIND